MVDINGVSLGKSIEYFPRAYLNPVKTPTIRDLIEYLSMTILIGACK